MATEDYVAGFNHACLFPYYGAPNTIHKDIYTSYNSLVQKLQHMYERQLEKQERLRLTILYLAHADPAHIESVKRVYIRLSKSEILMYENKSVARHDMLIDARAIENHAHSLKFTIPGYFFSEYGYADIVTGRTFHLQHILPVAFAGALMLLLRRRT
jgi:hypothetical protein